MKIEYNPIHLSTVITDLDRATWLDGQKAYYALPKNKRPDINPFDLEDSLQAYYKLYGLAKDGYGLNQVPPEVVEGIENLKQLAEIFNAYAYHILGLICRPGPTKGSK